MDDPLQHILTLLFQFGIHPARASTEVGHRIVKANRIIAETQIHVSQHSTHGFQSTRTLLTELLNGISSGHHRID